MVPSCERFDVRSEILKLKSAGVPKIRATVTLIWEEWKKFQGPSQVSLQKLWEDESVQSSWQTRAAVVYLSGYCASQDKRVLEFMRIFGARDLDWRVQECFAKAFDIYGHLKGYENILSDIEAWMKDSTPNVRRAASEGLRPWTKRKPFDKNPQLALKCLTVLLKDESDYVRRSALNAINDMRKDEV